jgi:hypothetical protein
MTTHTRCFIRSNRMGRWYLLSADLERHAWTGSRWSPCSELGMQTGYYRIESYSSENAARDAALAAGLIVTDTAAGDVRPSEP